MGWKVQELRNNQQHIPKSWSGDIIVCLLAVFVCDFISEIVNYTLTVVISCYCITCLQDFYELQKLCASPASLILAPSCCFGKSGEGVAVTHLSVWEVISQAVQKFVKHLKPRQITGKRCEHFLGEMYWKYTITQIRQPHLSMQRQVWLLLVRRQKPKRWHPSRSVRTKVKCCTAPPSLNLSRPKEKCTPELGNLWSKCYFQRPLSKVWFTKLQCPPLLP